MDDDETVDSMDISLEDNREWDFDYFMQREEQLVGPGPMVGQLSFPVGEPAAKKFYERAAAKFGDILLDCSPDMRKVAYKRIHALAKVFDPDRACRWIQQ